MENVAKNNAVVITIDGPSGAGKGTISQLLAAKLGWHFLDSGAIYRVLALAVDKHQLSYDDDSSIARLATELDLVFAERLPGEWSILLEGIDVSAEIRTEQCSSIASKISQYQTVRYALLERQQAFLQPPGLVADGRDMGTIVFPQAPLKFFLDASAEVRATRRYNQLKEKGIDGSLAQILQDLKQRDARDQQRQACPLRPADDAIVIDTTTLTIEQVMVNIWQAVVNRGLA